MNWNQCLTAGDLVAANLDDRLAEYLDINPFFSNRTERNRKRSTDMQLQPHVQGIRPMPLHQGDFPVAVEGLMRAVDVNNTARPISAPQILRVIGDSRKRLMTVTHEMLWALLAKSQNFRDLTNNPQFVVWANIDGNMLDVDLLNFIEFALDHHRAAPDSLGLEIHEKLRAPSEPWVMQRLREMGVHFALDDLGSPDSLMQLKEVTRAGLQDVLNLSPPGTVSKVKIDRSVASSRALLATILPMVMQMDGSMNVTVEGVEGDEQAQLLHRLVLGASIVTPHEARQLGVVQLANLVNEVVNDPYFGAMEEIPAGERERITVQGFHHGNRPKKLEVFLEELQRQRKAQR